LLLQHRYRFANVFRQSGLRRGRWRRPGAVICWFEMPARKPPFRHADPLWLPRAGVSTIIAEGSRETGMAEGLLGGVLGEDDEKSAVDAPDALAGAEAFASAVAAKLAGSDPEVARDTSAFLKKQARLLETQNRHLEDEHVLRVAHLRNQLREEKVRRFGLRLRVGFQLFVVLVATVIGIGIAVMFRDAVTSRRVVIEPFDAPPALAARGVTGKVIAAGLLDELSRLQDATRSASAARGFSGAWSGNIKLDVPETGVSVGEISRLLNERLGHDVHINGDLIESLAGGLALTVRGNGVSPKTFSGAATELEKLTIEAAEYVYSKSQPSR
jgi:hypothetical protein